MEIRPAVTAQCRAELRQFIDESRRAGDYKDDALALRDKIVNDGAERCADVITPLQEERLSADRERQSRIDFEIESTHTKMRLAAGALHAAITSHALKKGETLAGRPISASTIQDAYDSVCKPWPLCHVPE